METQGGCLCGALRYEIAGRVSGVGQCHCSVCRKGTGCGSTAVVVAGAKSFRWLEGEGSEARFARPGGWSVSFCPTCGSPVPKLHENGKVVLIPVGGLDGDPGLAVAQHIFVGSKAGWDVLGDDAPRHEEGADEA